MNQHFSKFLWLLLATWGWGHGQLMAQNPDWAVLTRLHHFNANGTITSTGMPGNYSFLCYASNAAQDELGNIMFFVVNEKIYDPSGILVGSTASNLQNNGKDILIVPDPNDCKARLVLTGYVEIVGPPTGNHIWHVNVTRVSKVGSNLVVQPNVFSYTLPGNDNAYMGMALSKPDINGQRKWYVATSWGAWQFQISGSGVSFVSKLQFPSGIIAEPTDVEVSPLGDMLMWSDRKYELCSVSLNTSNGAFLGFGSRSLLSPYSYRVYGLEFISNTEILVSATQMSFNGPQSGLYFVPLSSPGLLFYANQFYSTSQMERGLDGRVYASSSTDLWGKNPAFGLPSTLYGGSGCSAGGYYTLPKQLDFENYSTVFSCPICPPDATITGVYAKPLTESQSWIISSGACTIAANSTVKLDADPTNGYILFNPGFSANAAQSVVLVAQAFNGCAPGAPQILGLENEERNDEPEPAEEPIGNTTCKIFPNPTNGEVNLEFKDALESETLVTVMDLTGRTVLQTSLLQGESSQTFSLAPFPAGIYVVRISSEGKPVWTKKVVKE